MTDYIFWLSVLQIIWIDVILSGDNAIVISLACRELPDRQRRIGITLGVILALILRLIAAGLIVYLLEIPYLKILGGLLLFYIAIKTIIGEDGDPNQRTASSLIRAVVIIALADASMSLDNVVAIAAASRGSDLVFIIGLMVSMPLMIVGASLITKIITRFPILVWFGGGLLGWIAGELMATDPLVIEWLSILAIYGIACVGVIVTVSSALVAKKILRHT